MFRLHVQKLFLMVMIFNVPNTILNGFYNERFYCGITNDAFEQQVHRIRIGQTSFMFYYGRTIKITGNRKTNAS